MQGLHLLKKYLSNASSEALETSENNILQHSNHRRETHVTVLMQPFTHNLLLRLSLHYMANLWPLQIPLIMQNYADQPTE